MQGHFKTWEDEVIKKKWMSHSDKEIAKELGRKPASVERRRKHMGLVKRAGRPPERTKKDSILANPNEYSLATLSKDDRLEFYKSQFSKNHRYEFLKKTLFQEEMDYYKHKYIEFLDSIDTITLQEEDILHNMLMTEISILRIQQQIKDAIDLYKNGDEDDRRPPPQDLYQTLDKMESRYSDYHKKLNSTREDRLKKGQESKINIVTLVNSFLKQQNRNKAGRTAGIMDYYAKRSDEDMKKMGFLLGDIMQ